MSDYYIYAENGASIKSNAKTIVGAKREASKWLSFGAGDVSVENVKTGEKWVRRFWQHLNHFGWEQWIQIG